MRETDYGKELILDLRSCDAMRFTRRSIESYLIGLCDLIKMTRCELHFWDDQDVPAMQKQSAPKTKGISAVQFILTSNITIHTLELLAAAYINVFSCKDFDAPSAIRFSIEWFASKDYNHEIVIRR